MLDHHRIPHLDLRYTKGEPHVQSQAPSSRRTIDYSRVAGNTVTIAFIVFFIALSAGIIALFGPLIGILIVCGLIGKLKI